MFDVRRSHLISLWPNVNGGLHILGIRHLGPGSGRSVLRALDEIKSDCVLVAGLPDGGSLFPSAHSVRVRRTVSRTS